MDFEQIIDATVRLLDRYNCLEDEPDFKVIEEWIWIKAEEEKHPLTLTERPLRSKLKKTIQVI